MKRYKIILAGFGGIALMALGWLQWPWMFGSSPAFRAEAPLRLVFSNRNDRDFITNSISGGVTIHYHTRTNAEAKVCSDVLGILRQGRKSREHKCLNHGNLILFYADGTSVELGILPGHNDNRYEFRFGESLYSMPRKEFIGALQAMGVPDSKIPGIE